MCCVSSISDNAVTLWDEMIEHHFTEVLQERPPVANETQKQRANREARNVKRSNARTLLQEWRAMAPKYWKCFTKHYRNMGSISSQGGEIMNNAVKRRKHVSLKALIEMTNRVASNHMFDQLRSFDHASRIPLHSNINLWTDVLRSTLSEFSAKALTGQLKAAMKHRWSLDEDGLMRTENQQVSVNLLDHSCTCGYVNQHGLTCRHLMASMMASEPVVRCEDGTIAPPSSSVMRELAAMCMRTAHPRWSHAAVLRVIGEEKGEENVTATASESLGSDTDLDEPDVVVQRPPKHVPTSKVMRRLELEDLLERVQSSN